MQFDQLHRREVITLLGGAATVWPLTAHAQPRERMRRIGVLLPASSDDADFQAAFCGAELSGTSVLTKSRIS